MPRTATVISLFAAFTAAACLAEDEPTTDIRPGVVATPAPATIWQNEDLRYMFNTGEMLPPDHAWTELDEGICGCDARECEQQYVEDNWGCGLCVDAVCGDGSFAGGCFPCEDEGQELDHSPSPPPWQLVSQTGGAGEALEITDTDRFQGGWFGYRMLDQDAGVRLEVSGSNYTLIDDRAGIKHTGRLILDTTTAPHRITLFVADSDDAELVGTTNRGVYQLQGGQMAVTLAAPDADYPSDIVDGGDTFVFYRK